MDFIESKIGTFSSFNDLTRDIYYHSGFNSVLIGLGSITLTHQDKLIGLFFMRHEKIWTQYLN